MMRVVSRQSKWLASLVILVAVNLIIGGCAPANQPPLISSLTANEEHISPADICQIECIASDPDDDSLSYIWSANGGSISGEGSTVIWVAPDAAGAYTITVEVTDDNGDKVTAQLTINVVAINHPPVIDSLTSEWQRVRKAVASTIECIAQDQDGDELNYIWSAEGGNISGEGAVVTWVAPNAYGNYIITVTVTDGRGGEASDSIVIKVCSCPDAAS